MSWQLQQAITFERNKIRHFYRNQLAEIFRMIYSLTGFDEKKWGGGG